MSSHLVPPDLLARTDLTYEELCRLVPGEEPRVELVDGVPWLMAAPSRRHQQVLGNLYRALHAAAGEAAVYFAPLDTVLGESTALQPDLLVVLPDNRAILQDVVRGTPDLVVEVLSPSTGRRDRGLKRRIYARFGVREYWLVDPESETVEVNRSVEEGVYRLTRLHRAGEPVLTPLLPDLRIDPARLCAR